MQPEYVVVSRGYVEMAEAAWGGSLSAFAAFLEAAAKQSRELAGSDERVCATCGAVNFSADGMTHLGGTWLTWGDGKSWCGEHWADGDVYIYAPGREQVAARG